MENSKLRLLVIFTIVAGLFISCGTTSNVFDESLTTEKSAVLMIDPSIKVKTYNGIGVDLKTGMGYTGFTIPAGNADFLTDLEINAYTDAITGRRHMIRAHDVVFSYSFEAGKEYIIRCWYTDEEGKVTKSNFGRGLRMSVIISYKDDFYNALFIKKLGS